MTGGRSGSGSRNSSLDGDGPASEYRWKGLCSLIGNAEHVGHRRSSKDGLKQARFSTSLVSPHNIHIGRVIGFYLHE